MRRLLVPFLLTVAGLLTCAPRVGAQTFVPLKQWDHAFGSSGDDVFRAGQPTSDGGSILGGTSPSGLGGDKTQPSRGGLDYWLVKLDASGAKQWDRTFGGNGNDNLTAVQQTSDGGYLLGGYSDSPVSGDKTEPALNTGLVDYWVVKLDANGNKQWDRTIGGSSTDMLQAVHQTRDGGYLLSGQSYSPVSGHKTQPSRGLMDYWVVKLDANGTKQWDRTFGGSDNDFIEAAQQTPDGGYLLAGGSLSPISGDKTQPHYGSGDFWVVKLDANGDKQWDRTFGGQNSDYVTALHLTRDGGYLLGGYSDSPSSSTKTQSGQGLGDYWVVKLDASGAKQWDRTFGGTNYDYLYALEQTRDGGYLLGGYSNSPVGGDKTQPGQGGYDYWLVKLDASGAKQWDQAVGGPAGDYLYALAQTGDGGYLLGGYSASGPGGDKTQASRGGLDYWLVKLSPVRILTAPPVLCRLDTVLQLAATPAGGVWRGAGITDSQRGLFSAAAAGSGDHVVRYEVGSGTSRAADSLTVAVRPVPMPVVSPRGVVVARCGPASGLLSVAASTTAGTRYDWQYAADTARAWQSLAAANGQPTYPVTQVGWYRVRVTQGNCAATSSPVEASAAPLPATVIPNIFTPNHDQLNDQFELRLQEPRTSSLRVFNRWGQQVFASVTYGDFWTGSGASEGVYFYIWRYSTACEPTEREVKGWVQLVR